MVKFFIVKAKCGHVGKNWYIPNVFTVCAENRKEAASIVLQMPAVKRDHKDAILLVYETGKDEYDEAKKESINDYYWNKQNFGNKTNQALFFSRLEPETSHFPKRINKAAARKFRFRKAAHKERSLCDDIIKEFGISV